MGLEALLNNCRDYMAHNRDFLNKTDPNNPIVALTDKVNQNRENAAFLSSLKGKIRELKPEIAADGYLLVFISTAFATSIEKPEIAKNIILNYSPLKKLLTDYAFETNINKIGKGLCRIVENNKSNPDFITELKKETSDLSHLDDSEAYSLLIVIAKMLDGSDHLDEESTTQEVMDFVQGYSIPSAPATTTTTATSTATKSEPQTPRPAGAVGGIAARMAALSASQQPAKKSLTAADLGIKTSVAETRAIIEQLLGLKAQLKEIISGKLKEIRTTLAAGSTYDAATKGMDQAAKAKFDEFMAGQHGIVANRVAKKFEDLFVNVDGKDLAFLDKVKGNLAALLEGIPADMSVDEAIALLYVTEAYSYVLEVDKQKHTRFFTEPGYASSTELSNITAMQVLYNYYEYFYTNNARIAQIKGYEGSKNLAQTMELEIGDIIATGKQLPKGTETEIRAHLTNPQDWKVPAFWTRLNFSRLATNPNPPAWLAILKK